MGLVNPQQSSPGDTIEADDINTPISQLAAVINGNIESANIADSAVTSSEIADSAVTPAKLFSGTGATWPLQTWTVSWTNLTVGNGTVVAGYIQFGKLVYARCTLTFGSTTSVSGTVSVTPPVTAKSGVYTTQFKLGETHILDSGTDNFFGPVLFASTTSFEPRVHLASGTYVSSNIMNATTPMNWTTGDVLDFWVLYEAA